MGTSPTIYGTRLTIVAIGYKIHNQLFVGGKRPTTHKINLEECEPSVRAFFARLEGNANVIIYKDEKTCYFFGKIDNFPEEVRSLSNNQEFIDYLDRCRDRAKTESTLSLSEVRRRLAAES